MLVVVVQYHYKEKVYVDEAPGDFVALAYYACVCERERERLGFQIGSASSTPKMYMPCLGPM